MPKSRGRKPKKKRAPASAPKKRLDNLNATPQELPLSTQPPQEPPPLATAPRQEQSTPKIKQIAKLTTAIVLAAIAIVLCAYVFILTKQRGATRSTAGRDLPYTCRRRAGDAKSARRTQANRSSRARTKRFRRQLGGIGGEFFNTPVIRRRYPDNERGIATHRLHRKMANTPSQRDPAYRRNAETIPRGGVVFYRVLRNLREPTGRVDEGGNR